MDTPIEIDSDSSRIVYVKTVEVADLPLDMREQAEGLEHLYAVHSEDGERLALVSDRRAAFFLAREHDFDPVAVH